VRFFRENRLGAGVFSRVRTFAVSRTAPPVTTTFSNRPATSAAQCRPSTPTRAAGSDRRPSRNTTRTASTPGGSMPHATDHGAASSSRLRRAPPISAVLSVSADPAPAGSEPPAGAGGMASAVLMCAA
jgi:hypothetical protein